jgi:GT2 family glycosyltransferase
MTRRPSACVIVPFAGQQPELERMLDRLARLRLGPDDAVVLVDNRREPQPPARGPAPGVTIRHASTRSSSWHARDVGAGTAAAAQEWLIFIDADTRPAPDLIDRYLDPPPPDKVGVLAGGVRDWAATEATLCSRYTSARGKMDQRATLGNAYRPYAQTANCAVRRSAFVAVGGFAPGIGSSAAGDADLCWRLADAGWLLEERREAVVDHENRTRLRDLWRQLARHGAGLAWLERRYPGSAAPPTPRELVGRVPHYLLAAARAGTPEEAAFALADLACLYARDWGRLRPRDL